MYCVFFFFTLFQNLQTSDLITRTIGAISGQFLEGEHSFKWANSPVVPWNNCVKLYPSLHFVFNIWLFIHCCTWKRNSREGLPSCIIKAKVEQDYNIVDEYTFLSGLYFAIAWVMKSHRRKCLWKGKCKLMIYKWNMLYCINVFAIDQTIEIERVVYFCYSFIISI